MESYGKPEGTRVLPIDEKDQEIEEQETEGFVDMNKTRQIFEVPVLDMKNYGLDSTDRFSGSIAEQIVPRTLKPIKLYRDGLLMPKLVEQPPSEEEFALRRKLLKLEECTGDASIFRESRPQWFDRLCQDCAGYWIRSEAYRNQTDCPQPYLCGTCKYCRKFSRFLTYVLDFDFIEDVDLKEYKGSDCNRCYRKFPRLYRIYWENGKLKVGINFKEKQIFGLEFTPEHNGGVSRKYELQPELRTTRMRNMRRKCKLHVEDKFLFCLQCQRTPYSR